jgi:hypothetical protein
MGLDLFGSASDAKKTLYGGEATGTSLDKKGLSYSERYNTKALNELGSSSAAGTNALTYGYNTGRTDLTDAEAQALGYYDTGAADATAYSQKGIDTQEGLYDRGVQGIDDYTALINDPDSIYDSKVYQSYEDRGIEELNRLANSRGMLSSGNNTQDVLDYMAGTGMDWYKTQAGMYDPYFGLAQGGAAGMQQGYESQADTAKWGATGKAGVATNTGNSLSQLAAAYGKNVSDATSQTARDRAQLLANQGRLGNESYGSRATAARGTARDSANADSAANKESWSAILGLGKAAIGAV